MENITLNNGILMPILGYGVYHDFRMQVCREMVTFRRNGYDSKNSGMPSYK